MQITEHQFHDMEVRYRALVAGLPPRLRKVMPSLGLFLSPAHLNAWRFGFYDTEELSITGGQRWGWLNGPHARAMLMAYAVSRLPDNDVHP